MVCSGVAHVSISDHSLVYVYRKLSINLVKNWHCTVSYRNFKGFDAAKFCNPRANGAKRRSGRKPGARVTNFILGEFKFVARGS